MGRVRVGWGRCRVSYRGVLAVLVALSAGAHAQTVKLNGPLAQPAAGDVTDFLLSPDGTRVVYRADEAADNVYELFSGPLDGSSPTVKLNDPLPPWANVGGVGINVFGAGGGWDYAVSSTGHTVFLVDQNTNNLDELYSVPTDGSASPVRLNGPNVTGSGVMNFWILPGGTSVLYRADEGDTGNLYRVPIDGSAPATLIAPNFEPGTHVWISPDGSMAAFTVSFAFSRSSLYSVPTDGSAAPLLLGTTQPPINFGITVVENLRISDDATHAVFHQAFDEDGYEDADLFAVPLDGSHSPWLLNHQPLNPYERPFAFDGVFRVAFIDGADLVCVDLDGTQRVQINMGAWIPDTFGAALVLSADGTRVVFLARQGGQRALFSAPVDGSQNAIQLSSTAYLGQVEILASTVVYSSDTNLYRVPLFGGQAPVLLNPAPFGNNASFQIHPGGQDVVFRSEGGATGVSQLFTVPLDASALPRLLSAPLIPAGDVYQFLVAADGEHVIYRADPNQNETFELFGAPFAGGQVETYNAPMALGPVVGDVDSFLVTADEQRVVYRADQDEDQVFGLFATRADGRGETLSLAPSLSEGGNVLPGFALSPTGTRVAFLHSVGLGAAGWLYSATITHPAAPIALEVQTGLALQSQPLVIDSTGTRVFYHKQRGLFGPLDLRSVRLDGVGVARSLNPPSGSVGEFQLSPDGSLALYLSDQDLSGVMELYRVPADGSAPASKLNPPLAGAADVSAFGFTPDGLHVVYLADPGVDQQFELFSVPSDASAPAQLLSPALVVGGDVTHFQLTSDSAYVVFRADPSVDRTFDLFRVPLAGGAALPLTALPAGREAQIDFTLTADGQQVLLRANPNGVARYELFRVPADGSAGPLQLSGTLVAGGSVSSFALAPDQLRVVYLADERVDNRMELNGVALAGGASVLLHILPLGDVSGFRIAADSSRVAYRADAVQVGLFELFAVALDGSTPPERLNRPLPTGGDVQTDFAPLSDGRAVYRAEQEEDNVLELFIAFLAHPPRPAATPTQTRTVGQ
ncbi:MAG: hypothetical protein EXS08_10890 [Planctomycetes bacterium]|nr:hypothetical protein [Planctomycetota bacterium]